MCFKQLDIQSRKLDYTLYDRKSRLIDRWKLNLSHLAFKFDCSMRTWTEYRINAAYRIINADGNEKLLYVFRSFFPLAYPQQSYFRLGLFQLAGSRGLFSKPVAFDFSPRKPDYFFFLSPGVDMNVTTFP